MGKFDFINATSQSFSFCARQCPFLLRIALIPLVIKALSLLIIYAFGLHENFLRTGLLLIPSHFITAWYVCFCIRFALYQETWAHLSDQRVTALSAGIASFVLIQLTLSLGTGLLITDGIIPNDVLTAPAQGSDAEPNAMLSLALLSLVVAY